MSTHDDPAAPALTREVQEIYADFAREVGAHESDLSGTVPASFDVGSVRECLQLPLTLWESGRKPPRTVPALLAYERLLTSEETDAVARVLVGLDAFVTMMDEFIDTAGSDRGHRTRLAVNVAFSGLLSFSSIPATTRETVVDALVAYLLEASRIPAVEREVGEALADAPSDERAMELVRFSYGFRARDIAVFGTLPGLVHDVDPGTVERIASDLRTYRARWLLYDDIRDVGQDRENGIETPVTWLLDRHSDPEVVATRIEAVSRAFEYSNADYTDTLRDMERELERDELVERLSAAMAAPSD